MKLFWIFFSIALLTFTVRSHKLSQATLSPSSASGYKPGDSFTPKPQAVVNGTPLDARQYLRLTLARLFREQTQEKQELLAKVKECEARTKVPFKSECLTQFLKSAEVL